jgi:RND superfamily putative drug exporter
MTAVRDDRTDAPGAGAAPPPGGRWRLPTLVVAGFLLVVGPLGSLAGNLSDVQRNDSASYLPAGSEAAQALAASQRFTGVESTTAILVYTGSYQITDAERVAMIFAVNGITDHFDNRLAGPAIGPIVSDDRLAAHVIVPFVGSDPEQIRDHVAWLRRGATAAGTGLAVHVAGPAAAVADLTDIFTAVDGVLLLAAGGLVLLILIVVYRSPVLAFVVLAVAGIALGMAGGAAYLLADRGWLTVSGDARGILNVLVLGAATDYALLLVSRYRQELRSTQDKYEAMRAAWRGTAAPVLASGATVIAGLLCLLATDLPATRGLGPVAAIGIGCALLTMLVLLPATLVLCGRAAFWPFPPRSGAARRPDRDHGAATASERGRWWRLAERVGQRPRLVWTVLVLVLAGLALGMLRLEADGVPRTESFLTPVDSVAGQELLSEHFPDAAGTPAVMIAEAGRLDEVVTVAAAVPGITEVEPYVDPVERFIRREAGRPDPEPLVVDGRVRVTATLADPADSPQARETVLVLREAVGAIPGTLVGGYTAGNLDIQETAQRDRLVVIPLVLAAVLVILMLLLRAVVAPLLLTATVVLSFAATLGVSGVVFRDVFGFAGADSSLPLFAFVFLVALGVDYNIFLMTRVREETVRRGHRAGTIAGLAVTGGVITSAGLVLAATFAALAVLPLVFLAELAFAVGFGVLLDALVVRTLLVPALVLDIGRTSWWPSRTAAP